MGAFLCLLSPGAIGQIMYESSKAFKEPAFWTKLLILKNGSTLMFEVSNKEGIEVTAFDSKHIAKPAKKLNLKQVILKTQYVDILGIYEMNGQAVLFIQQMEKDPAFFRVIVDANGSLISEDKIGSLPTLSSGSGYAMAFGAVDIPGFDIVKDTDSDAYCVIIYDSFSKEAGKRIEMVHYDGSHKEIGRAFYNCPKEYPKLRYMNAFVKGTEYTYLIVYGYGSKDEEAKDSRIYIAKLSKGSTAFQSKELSYTDNFSGTSCEISYNKKAGVLNFILYTNVKVKRGEDYARCVFQPVLPGEFKFAEPFDLPFSRAGVYAKEKLLLKKDFKPTVMDVYLDDNGYYHALLQEAALTYSQNSGSQNLSLDNIGYSVFDNTGKEMGGMATALKYDLPGVTATQGGVTFRYMQAKEGYKPADRTIAVGKPKNWYKTVDMVYSSKNNYILFNDMAENFEVPEGKKVDNVLGMGGVLPFMIQVKNDGSFKKTHLFGTPVDKKDLKFCNFYASCYDRATGTYATIMTELAEDKKTYVIWMKLP